MDNNNYIFRSAIWTYQFFTHLSDRWSEGINFCPRLSDRQSECVTLHVQTDLRGVTSAIHNAVGLIIIILLGLGLWLVLGFMV